MPRARIQEVDVVEEVRMIQKISNLDAYLLILRC
jgi:hypothetical protein